MKSLIPVFALLMLAACETTPEPKVTGVLPAGDQPMSAVAATTTATEVKAAEPDCDDKAKQKVEIKENEVKLGGTDTGCKLE